LTLSANPNACRAADASGTRSVPYASR
jgi:hypothetical protein